MTLVIDASVAAKWVLPEDGADEATALRHNTRPLIAPDIVDAEVGNVLWKRWRKNEISGSDAVAALQVVSGLFDRKVAVSSLAESALRLAIEHDHPIYDCVYLALAAQEKASLATADRKLAALAVLEGLDVLQIA